MPKFDLPALLQAKGLLLVDSKPDVLHFFGDSLDELKKLIKAEKPDLTISHTVYPDFEMKAFQVYHPALKIAEFLRPRRLITNCQTLCSTYYKRLGIQTDINLVKPRPKQKFDSIKILFFVLTIWERFKKWMLWA